MVELSTVIIGSLGSLLYFVNILMLLVRGEILRVYRIRNKVLH